MSTNAIKILKRAVFLFSCGFSPHETQTDRDFLSVLNTEEEHFFSTEPLTNYEQTKRKKHES